MNPGRNQKAASIKKGIAVVASISCVGVALTGTASAAALRHSDGSVTNVVWWNMWSGGVIKGLDGLVTEFNATHPSIHVTQLNVPSSNGDAKLLSSIAAGDPPDIFTEWNPTIGEYAQNGLIQPLTKYMTGSYANLQKDTYPAVWDGGVYKGTVYGLSMGNGANELFYNKSIMKAAGITAPPTTLAQLDADQAKEWKFSGSRIDQMGFDPFQGTLNTYFSYFGVKDGGYTNGKYDLASEPAALKLADWMAGYAAKYPYAAVASFNSTYGANVGGYTEDPFAMAKAGFWVIGDWEATLNMPGDDPSMLSNFGVAPFPTVPGGPAGVTSFIWGNYNIIPKGAKSAQAAFVFDAWLAGIGNANYLDKNWVVPDGQMPSTPAESNAPNFTSFEQHNSWVGVFVKAMANPDSVQIARTQAQAEYTTALTTGTEYLATKKMTPMQVLQYVDNMANAALGKSKA